MVHGYLRAYTIEDVKGFKQATELDKLHVDVIHTKFDKNNYNLKSMFTELKKGDTLVINSISDSFVDTGDIASLLDLKELLGIDVLDLTGSDVLTLESNLLKESLEVFDIMHNSKKARYPDDFFDVYTRYKNKETPWGKAAKELKIGKSNFYNLIKLFEKED